MTTHASVKPSAGRSAAGKGKAVKGNDPFARLPEVPSFTVTSTTVIDGAPWPAEQMHASIPGGKDISPQLTWSGAPEGTKSYVVTVFDADAPTGSGFWHLGRRRHPRHHPRTT